MRKGAQETVCSAFVWKQLNSFQDQIPGKSDIIMIISSPYELLELTFKCSRCSSLGTKMKQHPGTNSSFCVPLT